MPSIIPIINNNINPNMNDIHNGLNTHHHDHVILPINFKMMNTIVNRPQNPIPPLDVLLLLILR